MFKITKILEDNEHVQIVENSATSEEDSDEDEMKIDKIYLTKDKEVLAHLFEICLYPSTKSILLGLVIILKI